MSTLFISHSSRDNAAAERLRQWLEEQGHRSLFLDLDPEKGIEAGTSWERTLYTKLRACRAVVALCSDPYLASHWCFAEIALARMEGKQIYVLQIDPWSESTKMSSILTEEQYIDLRTDPDEGFSGFFRGFEVKGITPAEAREWRPNLPPYPGLRSFQQEDSPIFFGREEEIRSGIEVLNQVRRQGHPRLVMVLGSSGSGKSSLVRAGIVPRLAAADGQWLVVGPFRPGAEPQQQNMEDQEDRRAVMKQKLEIGLTERFFVVLGLELKYDDDPAFARVSIFQSGMDTGDDLRVPKDKLDRKFTTSLAFRF